MGATIKNVDYLVWMLFFVLTGIQPSVVLAEEETDELPILFTPGLRINCQIPPEIKNARRSLVLWYRLNQSNWQQGSTFPAGNPITFTAPEDGVYEFVLEPAGSDAPPAVGAYRCMVDFNKPVLQVVEANCRQGAALVRWRAYDKNFSDQPIEIYLQSGRREIPLGKFANRGVAVVAVDPKDLPGRIKVIALDRAGNYALDFSKPIPAPTSAPAPAATQPAKPPEPELPTTTTSGPASPLDQNPEALREYKLGRSYRDRGNLAVAQVHFKKAIALAPKMIDAYLDLADALDASQRYNDAADYYLQALDLDGHNVKGLLGVAAGNLRQGRYAPAVECLEKVVATDKTNLQAWLSLGDAQLMLGKKAEARAAWQKAKALLGEPGNAAFEPKVDSRLKTIE